MSTRHLRQQLRRLKRRRGFGEREYEAAMKRHNARLEKRDLGFDIELDEIFQEIDQELQTEGNDSSKQVTNLSSNVSYQKKLARRDELCELLGEDTPERCADDQDTIEKYQLLHFGFLRPDYCGGWGRTIEEMHDNRCQYYSRNRTARDKKKSEEDFEEFMKAMEAEFMDSAESPSGSETKVREDSHAPDMISVESPNASKTKVGEKSHRASGEPSCPDGGSSSSFNGDSSPPSYTDSTVTPDDEESVPPDYEDVLPRLIGYVDNGVFVPLPKK